VLKTDTAYIKRDTSDLRTGVEKLRVSQERDFRMLFGAIIFVSLSLAGSWLKDLAGSIEIGR
jgi:hypothetical protein